ncbi:class I adenylate-forming enzyme family protein [Caballeronia sp. LZ035]|uniref:class I adenylate-forming enzyme family protein n=1 Tax=Caballeronia sp. LZ035 TaxID=3038568 RepID=UPI00285D6B74|nr:class I adenylate-forming enzyme family protein [Caballeronia sp. LZ035]MDR5760723.1 class I adenylate-forming enzyme family protein [Caballeronia sp. LZ035]
MNFSLFTELHARSEPDALALADERVRLSRAELDGWANRFAHWLNAMGHRPGSPVTLFLPNRAEVVIALLGAWKAGVVAVPLNWRLAGEELRRIVGHTNARSVVTTDAHAQAFVEMGARDVLCVTAQAREGSFWTALRAYPDTYASFQAQSGDVANLLYTSGSTSTPKAAIHTHGMRASIGGAMADCFKLSRRDVALAISPMFHTGGLSVACNALFAGCPLITMEKWDVERFVETLAHERVSFVHIIATLVVDIVRAPAEIFAPLQGRPPLRFTWGGGHSVTSEMLRTYEERLGGDFLLGYSRTEGGLTYQPLGAARRFTDHGLPNRNSADVAIFDWTTRAPCGVGEAGEICVRGDGVSPGYWDGDYVRTQRMTDGWQRTGDNGFFDADGHLHFLGRLDFMIKTGGENVYPEEVSRALLEIDGIRDAVVFGVPDARYGERVAALVVAQASGPALSANGIIEAARALLPGFKIPRLIQRVEELPKLGNGKVDMVAARRILQERVGGSECVDGV